MRSLYKVPVILAISTVFLTLAAYATTITWFYAGSVPASGSDISMLISAPLQFERLYTKEKHRMYVFPEEDNVTKIAELFKRSEAHRLEVVPANALHMFRDLFPVVIELLKAQRADNKPYTNLSLLGKNIDSDTERLREILSWVKIMYEKIDARVFLKDLYQPLILAYESYHGEDAHFFDLSTFIDEHRDGHENFLVDSAITNWREKLRVGEIPRWDLPRFIITPAGGADVWWMYTPKTSPNKSISPQVKLFTGVFLNALRNFLEAFPLAAEVKLMKYREAASPEIKVAEKSQLIKDPIMIQYAKSVQKAEEELTRVPLLTNITLGGAYPSEIRHYLTTLRLALPAVTAKYLTFNDLVSKLMDKEHATPGMKELNVKALLGEKLNVLFPSPSPNVFKIRMVAPDASVGGGMGEPNIFCSEEIGYCKQISGGWKNSLNFMERIPDEKILLTDIEVANRKPAFKITMPYRGERRPPATAPGVSLP